jgi:hypothetical protein
MPISGTRIAMKRGIGGLFSIIVKKLKRRRCKIGLILSEVGNSSSKPMSDCRKEKV